MSNLTYEQARDETLAMFKTAWDTTGYPVVWPDKGDSKPTETGPWAQVKFAHSLGTQESLANHLGERLWKRRGRLFVQIATPSGDGATEGYSLAKTVGDAFEGQKSPSGIWFVRTTINELGNTGDWYLINVITDFEYNERK